MSDCTPHWPPPGPSAEGGPCSWTQLTKGSRYLGCDMHTHAHARKVLRTSYRTRLF